MYDRYPVNPIRAPISNFSDPFGLCPEEQKVNGVCPTLTGGNIFGILGGPLVKGAGLLKAAPSAGRFLRSLGRTGSLGKAVSAFRGASRTLSASSLGVEGVQEFAATFSVADDVATVGVSMLKADGASNLFGVLNRLTELASDAGATTLRIEASLADEQLLSLLQRRLQSVEPTGGFTEAFEIVIGR